MNAERIRVLLPAWRASRWEVRQAASFAGIPPGLRRGAAAVSAWNPGSRPLSRGANRDRDAALRRVLRAQGVPHRRCRGRLGAWCEEGWLVPDDRRVVLPLLRAFGQLAAQAWDARGPRLRWARGG